MDLLREMFEGRDEFTTFDERRAYSLGYIGGVIGAMEDIRGRVETAIQLGAAEPVDLATVFRETSDEFASALEAKVAFIVGVVVDRLVEADKAAGREITDAHVEEVKRRLMETMTITDAHVEQALGRLQETIETDATYYFVAACDVDSGLAEIWAHRQSTNPELSEDEAAQLISEGRYHSQGFCQLACYRATERLWRHADNADGGLSVWVVLLADGTLDLEVAE